MVFIRINYKRIIFVIILLFLNIGTSNALDDEFDPARKIEGEYFNIYHMPQIGILSLSYQLNISPSDKLLVGKSVKQGSSAEAELADMVDTLFLQICDILDMHFYKFKGNIKICADDQQLKEIYSNLFIDELAAHTHSFYVYSSNTIYISKDYFKREVLGREIGHAVISYYFVVQPSVKIQEVLVGYVEYQLRKVGQ